MNNWITGVDIGGTHITVCMVDADSGKLLTNTLIRHPVDPHKSADEIITGWSDAIEACWKLANIQSARIGIAMPGPFDYEKGICLIKGLQKYDALYKLPVKDLLSRKLGLDPFEIKMVNDATAYIRGEVNMGSAKGADEVLGLTLGTGLGSALYRNGAFEEGDLYCFPYRDTAAEEYFATRWFINTYEQKTGRRLAGVKELAELSGTDPFVKDCFIEYGKNMAEMIRLRYAPQIPRTIVIGGNIAKAASLFFPSIQQELGPLYEVKRALIGEHAALIGGAYLWKSFKGRDS